MSAVPLGPSDCPHSETAGQRGWRYTDLTNVLIMPMREAV